MAAPDMPHPARAPHRPQNSAEFHHDDDDELDELVLLFLGGSTAFLSLNLRVVDDHWEDCVVLDFGPGARSRTRRSVVLDDDTTFRVAVAGERRRSPIIVVVVVEENFWCRARTRMQQRRSAVYRQGLVRFCAHVSLFYPEK